MKISRPRLDRASAIVVVATVVGVMSCLIVPESLARADHQGISFWKGFVLVLTLIATLFAPLVFSVCSIVYCLVHSVPKPIRLVRIIAAYVANLLLFAALYYSLTLIGDEGDARRKHIYYRYYPTDNAKFYEKYKCDMPACRDTRSFNGVTERLFSGIDWEPEEDSSTRRWTEPPIPFLVARAMQPEDEVIRFLPDARGPVFLDCLHFSVVTLATVGYGDVSPSNWAARAAADCQIILGVTLLVLVVGMFFSGWWDNLTSGKSDLPNAADDKGASDPGGGNAQPTAAAGGARPDSKSNSCSPPR